MEMKMIQALKIVFGKDSGVNLVYISLLLFFVIAFIFFFIELQVLLTPEPDNFSLYLKIWQIKDWLIVGLLSILFSLNFVFFVYLVKIKNNYPNNRPNKLPESSDRIDYTRIERPNNIYPNKRPNNNIHPNDNRINYPNNRPNGNEIFGQDSGNDIGFGPDSGNEFGIDSGSEHSFGQYSGNTFGPHSGSKNKLGPNSGKVFGQYSGRNIIFGHDSGKNIFIGILGTLSGIFSAILATALCSSCLAVLFSLLGISFSTGIFFLKYKFLIFLLSAILLLISLHFQSKRIINKCQC
jgi:hypothetical protein